MKNSWFKLPLRKYGLNTRQDFLSQRIVEHHNKLLGEATVSQCSHAVYFADPG